jgi:tyrosyl-tRNA synthetase
MTKIITDKEKINEVLTRGVENVYPNVATTFKYLSSGKRLRFYCGFDPTAPSLHIGNAIQLNKLAQLQGLGHEIIFLVGDFTGMIGDPTDKTSTRKRLTREEVTANAKNYQKQASAYLEFAGENPAKVMHNSKWLDSMTFRDLVEVASNFTVGQMMVRDMFQERIKEEKPIHLHEFLYPLAQAIDSDEMDVDGEVGGNDQTFNMLCGRDLLKATKKKDKIVITTKLLADDTGKKMGKTEGNVVNLDEEPENMYGKVMSWPDGVIITGMELCTKMPITEVEAAKAALSGGTNPRDLKMKLAYAITELAWGEKKASAAEDYFVRTVQKKEVPKEVKSLKLGVKKLNIVELLVETELAASKGEARRLIEQGGIKMGGETVKDIKKEVDLSKEVMLQRGKLNFIKVSK